jgi:beta-lactam-binding protein with PASTA domain
MIEFLKSKQFLYNIGAIILSIIVFFWLGTTIISSFTQHGQTITVPDLSGKKLSEVKSILESKQLEFEIVDSSYSAKLNPLSVIDQNPKPNSKVKEERTIYLTINALNPPKVKMPDLKDASLKQAQMALESYGLKLGRLIYKPDLAQNAVLEQEYQGKNISPGTLIAKGSKIDLVLGDGLGQSEFPVPDLVGMTLAEAKFNLEASDLNLGVVVNDNTCTADDDNAKIYKQVPSPDDSQNMIKPGEPVDVFITTDESKVAKGDE